MNIFKIVIFGIVATILVIILSEQKKEMALLITIFASVTILILVLNELSGIITLLEDLIDKTGVNKTFLAVILKITAITYLVEFGKNVCQDAGQTAIATKIELAGKIIIVSLSIPIITSLVTILNGLI